MFPYNAVPIVKPELLFETPFNVREPNLLVPGEKPVGNVVADLTHPDLDGAVAWWLYAGNGGNVRDIINNIHSSGIGSGNAWTVHNRQCAVDYGATNGTQVPSNDLLSVSYITILIDYNKDNATGSGVYYDRLLSRGSDGATKSRYDFYHEAGGSDPRGELTFGMYDSGSIYRSFTSSLFPAAGRNKVGISYDGSNTRFVLISPSGVVSSDTVAGAHGVIKSTDGNDLYLGSYLNGTTHALDGKIYTVRLYGKAYSIYRMTNMLKDLYAPAIPA